MSRRGPCLGVLVLPVVCALAVLPFNNQRGFGQAVSSPSATPTEKPQGEEAAFEVFQKQLEDEIKKLPPALSSAKGIDFLLAHIQAIAEMKSPEAKAFAADLAAVVRKHKLALSPALAALPVRDPAKPDAVTLELLDASESIHLIAILMHMEEPEKNPFENRDAATPYIPFLLEMQETVALRAPSIFVRMRAVVNLASTESVLNISIDDDEDLSQTWVAPARVARAWDALFTDILSVPKGVFSPWARAFFSQFNGEILALYMIPHGLVDKPEKNILTATLDRLAKQAEDTRPKLTAAEDRAALDEFLKGIDQSKKYAAAENQGFEDRLVVKGMLEQFVAALNKKDAEGVKKVLTPAAVRILPEVGEFSDKLMKKGGVHDIKLFFVAAPDESGRDEGQVSFHLAFYLQATDSTGKICYTRQEAALVKEGETWRMREIYLVLDPEAQK